MSTQYKTEVISLSYCVNCGVELDKTAVKCPLCGTGVLNPASPVDTVSPPPYPVETAGLEEPPSRSELALLLSVMLAAASVACGILNLLLFYSSGAWSLYVIGLCVMLWIIIVPALLMGGLHLYLRLFFNMVAISIYVFLMALDLDGTDWYTGVALPIIILLWVIIFLLFIIDKGHRRSKLTMSALILGASGFFTACVEMIINRYIAGDIYISWSIVVMVCCGAVILPLVIIRRRPRLRAEARKRFHI